MGIINNDLFELSNGVQKLGTYISFNNETIYLRRNNMYMAPVSSNVSYMVSGNYRIYWDKNSKNNGKNFMESRFISLTLYESELSANLYERLYEKLKVQFPNSVDDLEPDVVQNSNVNVPTLVSVPLVNPLLSSSGHSGSSQPLVNPLLSSSGPSGSSQPLSDPLLSSSGPSGSSQPLSDPLLSSSGPSGSSQPLSDPLLSSSGPSGSSQPLSDPLLSSSGPSGSNILP